MSALRTMVSSSDKPSHSTLPCIQDPDAGTCIDLGAIRKFPWRECARQLQHRSGVLARPLRSLDETAIGGDRKPAGRVVPLLIAGGCAGAADRAAVQHLELADQATFHGEQRGVQSIDHVRHVPADDANRVLELVLGDRLARHRTTLGRSRAADKPIRALSPRPRCVTRPDCQSDQRRYSTHDQCWPVRQRLSIRRPMAYGQVPDSASPVSCDDTTGATASFSGERPCR